MATAKGLLVKTNFKDEENNRYVCSGLHGGAERWTLQGIFPEVGVRSPKVDVRAVRLRRLSWQQEQLLNGRGVQQHLRHCE